MVTRGTTGRTLLALWVALLLAVVAPAQAADRIVSLAPSLTEMVHDLGMSDRLAGRLEGGQLSPPLQRIPVIGIAGQLDMERLLQLQPDLVLYWPGSIGIQQLHKLEQLQIPVFHARATTMQELAAQYEQLGERLGAAEQGRKLGAQIRQRLQALQQIHAGKPSVALFYQLWDKPVFTLGGGQIVSDALSYCGAHNIFADLETPAPQVNLEMVMARNPQLVLLSRDGLRDSWPASIQLPMLVVPDDGLDRPSLQMLDALEQLCQAIDDFRSNRI